GRAGDHLPSVIHFESLCSSCPLRPWWLSFRVGGLRSIQMSEDLAEVRRIPEQAQRRLEEMRGQAGGPPRLFTSDLSVNEFLMVEEAGFEPLGFVMGSSFFHIGIQWTMQPFQNYELDVLTAALYHAREYAMARMEEEAHI